MLSGHKTPARLVAISSALVCIVACPGQEQPKPVSQRDAAALFPLITPLVAKQEPFPHDAKVKIQLTGGGARRVILNGESRVVMPVLIRFDRYDNTYCRVAVIDKEKKMAELVPVPGNFEHCEGLDKMPDVDLNHDGIPDLVFQLNMPSNRSAATVSEGAVYLSQPALRTYCYAPAASGQITSDVPPQADKIAAVMQSAVERRGPQVLNCYTPANSGINPK